MFTKWLLLVALMISPVVLSAQTKDTTMIMVPKSALSPTQLSELESKNIAERAKAYGAWVGVGKEVGEAVNSSLAAVTDNAAKFADTKIGKYTMFIVVWKVIGKDILGFIYAFSIAAIGLPVLIWSYRQWSKQPLETETVVDGKITERKYRERSFDENEQRVGAGLLHAFGAMILLVAASIAQLDN